MKVRVYLNESEGPRKFVDGYIDGDPLRFAIAFDFRADVFVERMEHTVALDAAFRMFNIGHEHLFGSPRRPSYYDAVITMYRFDRNRSLSVGDVVEIDGVRYACQSVGWQQLP